MATHLRANGVTKVIFPQDEVFTLEELQGLVGGYIEVVSIPDLKNSKLVVNEDGQLMGLPVNAMASSLLRQMVAGDAVVVHPDEWKG